MNRALRFLAVFLLLSFVQSIHAQDRRGLEVAARQIAGDSVRIGRQVVVIVAINKYRDWNPLRTPVQDAKELREILGRRYWVDQFIELYDEQATKSNIIKLLSGLNTDTGPDDSVFIYYAGHGYLDQSKTGFWIPVDAGTDLFAQDNWIPNVQVRNLITGMKARHVVLISDSCFSGDILNITRGAAPEFNNEYFRNAYRRMARQVLTSGASETVADDSSFSKQLKMALDHNYEPYIDPYALFDQIRRGVTGQTPLYGTIAGAHQDGGSFLFFLKDTGAGTPVATAAFASTVQPVRGFADLVVTTQPEGAVILLDGKEVGRSDKALILPRLEAGRAFKLEARLGDLEASREVSLVAGAAEAVALKLEPGKGTLFIQAPEEAKGSRVFIDGIEVGAFDTGMYRDVVAGPHRFEIRGDFISCDMQVKVSPRSTSSANAVIKRFASLSLRLPEYLQDATMTVDGNAAVVTGSVLRLEAGDHALRLEHPAIQPVAEKLPFAFGATVSWSPKLTYRTGSLTIRACPPDAELVLSLADPAGSRPRVIGQDIVYDGLAVGQRTLIVRSPYLREEGVLTATITEGGSALVDFPAGIELGRLAPDEPIAGRFQVSYTDASGNRNELQDLSPLLPPGSYELWFEFKRSGMSGLSLSVEVCPGLTTLVPVSLAARLAEVESRASIKRNHMKMSKLSLAVAAVGVAGAGLSYWLGKNVMADYEAAETSAAAADARSTAKTIGSLMFVSLGAGGLSLAASPVLFFSGPDPQELDRQADELSEFIEAYQEARR